MINYGIIDVRAVINGKNIVDIEMQVADKEKVRIAELREKYILDRNTEIRNAEAKGRQIEKTEMVRKMKQKNMDTQTIMELTGLTKEEINNIK